MQDVQRSKPAMPPIALRRADQEALLAIAYRGLLSDTRSAGALLCEASRANLLADDDAVLTATLGSRVCFRDNRSAEVQIARLVTPEQHGLAGCVSVLSPLGAALIGLSAGQTISCPDRRGGQLNLTVLHIAPPSQLRGETP
jgi:regulator of nucleoside diphosphate kinase